MKDHRYSRLLKKGEVIQNTGNVIINGGEKRERGEDTFRE